MRRLNSRPDLTSGLIESVYHHGVDRRLPLSALLSHVLVAYTIELDNEFEHGMPHRTTNHGSTTPSGPWLVSVVMWWNCMRFVDAQGVTVGELRELARTETNLNGMERWGYVTVAPDPAAGGPKPPPRSKWVIHATSKGRQAREMWQTLRGVIEKRWQERFGKTAIDELRRSLLALVSQIDLTLPDCLPILGYGLFSKDRVLEGRSPHQGGRENLSSLALSALLSKVLLAFAIEFEQDSEVSLAIGANVLRLAGGEGVRVRDLPCLAGVSKESIAMSLSFLENRGLAVVRPASDGSRVKVLSLTAKGRRAQERYVELVGEIEERWRERFGGDNLRSLRESLGQLAGDAQSGSSPLVQGLDPYPDGWRASVRRMEGLPHYPMLLHRGGFPDGS